MQWISQLIFLLILGAGVWYFAKQVKTIRRNIFLGRKEDLSDQPKRRWAQMARVALRSGKNDKKTCCGYSSYYCLCWLCSHKHRGNGNYYRRPCWDTPSL